MNLSFWNNETTIPVLIQFLVFFLKIQISEIYQILLEYFTKLCKFNIDMKFQILKTSIFPIILYYCGKEKTKSNLNHTINRCFKFLFNLLNFNPEYFLINDTYIEDFILKKTIEFCLDYFSGCDKTRVEIDVYIIKVIKNIIAIKREKILDYFFQINFFNKILNSLNCENSFNLILSVIHLMSLVFQYDPKFAEVKILFKILFKEFRKENILEFHNTIISFILETDKNVFSKEEEIIILEIFNEIFYFYYNLLDKRDKDFYELFLNSDLFKNLSILEFKNYPIFEKFKEFFFFDLIKNILNMRDITLFEKFLKRKKKFFMEIVNYKEDDPSFKEIYSIFMSYIEDFILPQFENLKDCINSNEEFSELILEILEETLN